MVAEAQGTRIRDARQRLGLTLEQVASRADLAVKTVWAAEHGKEVSPKTLHRLGQVLDLEFFPREVSA